MKNPLSIFNSVGKYIPANSLEKDQKRERTRRQRLKLQNLGIISKDDKSVCQVYRDKRLHELDSYYENTQYNHLPAWDQKDQSSEDRIPLTKRKPKIIYPYARNLASRVGAKIVGDSVFPKFVIEDSPDDQEFFRAIIKQSRLKAYLVEPVRRCINTGSVFVRFKIVAGTYKIQWYHSKFCYPTFQDNDELQSVVIKYIYDDPSEVDADGNPVKKWYKLELGTEKEILYDNPVYDPKAEEEPEFKVISEVEHGFGFVQGEWWTTSENQGETDGYGLVSDVKSFVDELNYSISSSSRAIQYNQDPQLTIKGIPEDEMTEIIRSVTKSWNLGREGEAGFLESNLVGAERAATLRDKVRGSIGELTRATINDPDKMVAVAQSARAMEVLNEPLIDLVDELRSSFEMHFKNLVLKMALATLLAKDMGLDVPLMIPDGYRPKSLDLEIKWPPVFKLTIEDMQKGVNVASAAANANIISRKTATKFVSNYFEIEDIEAEHAEISNQPVFNPFMGGF